MGFFVKKLAYLIFLLYICSRFGKEMRNYEGEVDKYRG